jgi:hypothetical protein
MCNCVGADIDKLDVLRDEWQEEFDWSVEEEQRFQDWLYKYLVTNSDALFEISTYRPNEPVTATELMTLVKEFTLFYGWALKEDVDLDNIEENKPKKT